MRLAVESASDGVPGARQLRQAGRCALSGRLPEGAPGRCVAEPTIRLFVCLRALGSGSQSQL